MSPGILDTRDYESDGDDDVRLMDGQDVPDTSAQLYELAANDFPRYFTERGGRLFHSHHSSPYPLPADTPEQQVTKFLSCQVEAYHISFSVFSF
jgi:hypothetical protein